MTKSAFHRLFVRALNAAAAHAEARLGRPVPRCFLVELHAPNSSGATIGVDQALDEVYLGQDRFYRIIDVAIRGVSGGEAIAFVRVSGHSPGPFSDTWDPSDMGPFKQIEAQTIEQA